MKLKYLFIAILLASAGLFSTQAKAQLLPPPTYSIQFYWDNWGNLSRPNGMFTSGSSVIPVTNNPVVHLDLGVLTNLKDTHRYPDNHDLNDHARSAVINASGPVTFTVYDSPSGSTGDDYTTITVKQAVSNYLIPTFEANIINDPYVTVTFHHDNGLDGKVSSLRITR